MVVSKKGSYLQQLNVNTGVISCQWGNVEPADTCRGQYGAEYSFTQSSDNTMPNEFNYTAIDGPWHNFLNRDRVKVVAGSVVAETELADLLKECGNDKKKLLELLESAMKNSRDNSCNEKSVKRFQTPVLGPDFQAGKTGKAGEHTAGLTTAAFINDWTEFYEKEEINDSKKEAGLLGLKEKLLPALEASYKKQWPLKINDVTFLDSRGKEMSHQDIARYVNWNGSKVNLNLNIKKLRFVQVGQITHFNPEIIINSVTLIQNGPPRKSAKARTFSAMDCLVASTENDEMSDSEILTQVQAAEEDVQEVPEKRRKTKKKKTFWQSQEQRICRC